MKKILSNFAFLIILLFPKVTYGALTFNISSADPLTLESRDSIINIGIDVNELPNESYFRVAFQKLSGGNYYGYNKVNDEWTKIEPLSFDCTKYLLVEDLATSHINIELKIGDSDIEPGEHKLIVHRFTSGCNATKAESENYIANIKIPTPTPTPTKTPTPTPQKTDPPQKTPTATPKATPLPTTTTSVLGSAKTPTSSPRSTSTSAPRSFATSLEEETATSEPEVLADQDKRLIAKPVAVIISLAGLVFISYPVIQFYKKRRLKNNNDK